MAISPLITVSGEWVNLYASAVPPITVGTRVIVQNFSSKSPVALADSASEPTATTGRVRIDETQFYQNTAGDLGLWAYCSSTAMISIQEVS